MTIDCVSCHPAHKSRTHTHHLPEMLLLMMLRYFCVCVCARDVLFMYIWCLSYQIMSLKSNLNDSLHAFPQLSTESFFAIVSVRTVWKYVQILSLFVFYRFVLSIYACILLWLRFVRFVHLFSVNFLSTCIFQSNNNRKRIHQKPTISTLSLCSCSSFFVCYFSSQVLQYWCHKPYYLYWFGELLHRRVKPFHF